MSSVLARLERRFGRFAFENLTAAIVGGMALVFVVSMLQPTFPALLLLDLDAVAHGQVWRLFTFLFLPPPTTWLWIVFALSVTWTVGSSLEAEWGAFKYNVYYLLGALATIGAALITRESISNTFLNATLFLAFATMFPRYELRLFFILPVQVRFLALVDVGYLGYAFATGDMATRAGIGVAVANYFLFFTTTLIDVAKGHERQVRQRARRDELRGGGATDGGGNGTSSAATGNGQRVCALCGTREVDGADIRVCTCATCQATGGPRTLCLPHARAAH